MSEQEDVKFDMLMIGIYIDNGIMRSILSNRNMVLIMVNGETNSSNLSN
jgi:hypothetical protein